MIKKMDLIFKMESFPNVSKYTKLFFTYLVISVFIYADKFINISPNPDAIWNSTIYKTSFEWEIGLGRYLIALIQLLRGYVINTTLVTLLSLIFLSLICVFIIKIFGINRLIWQILCGIIIILSPSVGCTLTYYYCSDMYLFSYFCSVIAVYFLISRHSLSGVFLSGILLSISCSIYQAYLGIAIMLCFMYIFMMILDDNMILSQIFKQIVRFLSGGSGGVVLYLLSNKLIQTALNIDAVENRGFSTMGIINLGEIPEQIWQCYIHFYHYFFSSTMINNMAHHGERRFINFIVFVIIGLSIILFLMYRKLAISRKALCIGFTLIIPIASMSIIIWAPETNILSSTGVLMLPTMNYIYIWGILLLMKIPFFKQNLLNYMGVLVYTSVICMLLNLELAGQSYMKHYMQKTDFVAYQMVNAIEAKVDNSSQYQLCIIGNMEEGNFPEQYPELYESLHWLTPSYRTIWSDFNATQGCWMSYFKQFIGKDYNSCDYGEYQKIIESGVLNKMGNFPDENSVCIYGNELIVLKLSDTLW